MGGNNQLWNSFLTVSTSLNPFIKKKKVRICSLYGLVNTEGQKFDYSSEILDWLVYLFRTKRQIIEERINSGVKIQMLQILHKTHWAFGPVYVEESCSG